MAARKSLTTPDSNSMVLRAAVDPEIKRVRRPSATPVFATLPLTGSVRSNMSVPAVVLISRVNASNQNIANLDVSKILHKLQGFNSWCWWVFLQPRGPVSLEAAQVAPGGGAGGPPWPCLANITDSAWYGSWDIVPHNLKELRPGAAISRPVPIPAGPCPRGWRCRGWGPRRIGH
jgi:hypothetical protein